MSDLWTWAVAAYARPGVEEACLALQDDHAVNVCYLLWAAWGEAEGRPLDLPAGAALALDWERAVAAPLRLTRRALKPSKPGIADAAREDLRGEVKRLELAAERLLLESLAALPSGDAPTTLTLAATAWTPTPDAHSVERLHSPLANWRYGAGEARDEMGV